MRQKNIKIVGILLCVLVLGTLIPAVVAVPSVPQTSNDPAEPTTKVPVAMVMGRLTNVHRIGKLIVAHAVRLRYFGWDFDRGLDHGMLRNQFVMFRDTMRLHMFHMGMDTMVFGHVLRLRYFF